MRYTPTSPDKLYIPFTFAYVGKRLFLLLFLVFIALLLTPWQQTIYGEGQVIAYSPGERKQVISAPISGLIDEWYVNEGTFVKKGQKVVRLKDQDKNLMQRLYAERKAITTRLDVLKQAAEISMINVKRQKKLYQDGINGRRKYELAKFEYAKYLSDIAKAKVDLLKIKSRIARQSAQLVRAPLDGTIVHRLSGSDSLLIKEGDVLAEIVPNTNSRALELFIQGVDLPLIHVNDVVVLQFEGWPAIQFSGWPSLAVNTFKGKIAVIDPVSTGRGYFRILVIPIKGEKWPGPNYLRQGVRVHGWVQLNMVPLWFELWRRFNGFPAQPSQSEKKEKDK